MNVLSRIVEVKRAEVARSRARLPADVLAAQLKRVPAPRDFAAELRSGDPPSIIAEVKRASPSRGVLRRNGRPPRHQGRVTSEKERSPVALPKEAQQWQAEDLARAYGRGGARCLSVLTDITYFWGHPDYVLACGQAAALPVLRKDFIVEPYQVDESRWLGADALLLMASVLQPEILESCLERTMELGMTALIEVHTAEELEQVMALGADPDRAVIGINHRNLQTLDLHMERAIELRQEIDPKYTVVAESGLETAEDLRRLMAAGIDAFLIGGHLAASEDPESTLRELNQA